MSLTVGIITGDVVLNPKAECLIMTTEILRNKLYINCSSLANLQCVVFDEVHYINNEERGSVWEETIILLPKMTSLVMLSATVENVDEFGDWVSRITKRPMQIIRTSHRPVPLKHFLWFRKEYLIKNHSEKFDEAFVRAQKAKLEAESKDKMKQRIFIKESLVARLNQMKEMKNQKLRVQKVSRRKTSKNQRHFGANKDGARQFNREERNVGLSGE